MRIILSLSAFLLTLPALAEDIEMPDPLMTPGAVDPSVDLSAICNGTTKTRRARTTKVCDRVFADYNIPASDRYHYECDHLIPLALGGANDARNLWPQPNDQAEIKDRLEVELQRRACVAYRTFTPEDAAKVLAGEQAAVARDWTAIK